MRHVCGFPSSPPMISHSAARSATHTKASGRVVECRYRRIGEGERESQCASRWQRLAAAYCDENLIENLINAENNDEMSSGADECKLKGGHPPAVKAGGMRITQHKTPKDERETKPSSKDVEESRPSTSPPKTIMISGAPAKGNADFPPEAVQHFHEKPTPTHDARPAHCSRPIIIQQPRK